MASADNQASRPNEEFWQHVDAFVQRFDKAWQNGDHPSIEGFLLEDGPLRLAVLKELVHVDMERRRQAGEPVRLEDYLQRFPELEADAPSITGSTTLRLLIIGAHPDDAEYHAGGTAVLYRVAGHGFGLRENATSVRVAGWPVRVKEWMIDLDIMKGTKLTR